MSTTHGFAFLYFNDASSASFKICPPCSDGRWQKSGLSAVSAEYGGGGSKEGQNFFPPTATREVCLKYLVVETGYQLLLSSRGDRGQTQLVIFTLPADEDCPQDETDLSQHQLYVLLLSQAGQHTQAGDQFILSTIFIRKLHLWYCCLSQLYCYETVVERPTDFPLLVEQLHHLPPGPVHLILHLYQEHCMQKLAGEEWHSSIYLITWLDVTSLLLLLVISTISVASSLKVASCVLGTAGHLTPRGGFSSPKLL